MIFFLHKNVDSRKTAERQRANIKFNQCTSSGYLVLQHLQCKQTIFCAGNVSGCDSRLFYRFSHGATVYAAMFLLLNFQAAKFAMVFVAFFCIYLFSKCLLSMEQFPNESTAPKRIKIYTLFVKVSCFVVEHSVISGKIFEIQWCDCIKVINSFKRTLINSF